MLTTKQAAKLKKLTVRAIQQQIKRGTLKATLCQCGQSHLIDERDLNMMEHKKNK